MRGGRFHQRLPSISYVYKSFGGQLGCPPSGYCPLFKVSGIRGSTVLTILFQDILFGYFPGHPRISYWTSVYYSYLSVHGHLVMDDVLHFGEVETTSCHIRCYQQSSGTRIEPRAQWIDRQVIRTLNLANLSRFLRR